MNIDPPFRIFIDEISKKFQDCAELKQQLDFNIFSLVSDKYVLENFHSDIISKLLDPNSGHGDGSRFLEAFIIALNRKNLQLNLSPPLFKDAYVEREVNRIDIAIKSESSRTAIIIENKINNAKDQKKQLPNYYSKLKNEGFNVVAIVYLTLHGEKSPDTTEWDEYIKREIFRILVRLPAFQGANDNSYDLLNLWIKPCIGIAQIENNREIFNQYRKLILKIATMVENIDASILMYEKFKTDKDLLSNSVSLYSSMELFTKYLASKIATDLPKFMISPNRTSVHLGNFNFKNSYLAVVVEIALLESIGFSYNLRIWDTYEREEGCLNVEFFLGELINDLSLLKEENGEFRKLYLFPNDETILMEDLNKLIRKRELLEN